MDLPRSFVIREGDLRILNPFAPTKLATLGDAIKLRPGLRLVDLCCGKGEMLASWAERHGITGVGVDGTVKIMERSLRPGGLLLVGEPYWRLDPPDQATVEACHARSSDEFPPLPALVAHFGDLGWDVVEMVLSNQDDWDRYAAAHWLNLRTWLDANPDDPLAPELRAELDTDPTRHVRYRREYLGWGVFALMKR